MGSDKKHKHVKVIDVEAVDENDDDFNGPVDTVDIFDSVAGGADTRPRNKRLVDIENPLSDEDKQLVDENTFKSEPDDGEQD